MIGARLAALVLVLAAAPTTEVSLTPVGAASLSRLRKNPTRGLRLIHVWATWCAPCIVELPEIVEIDRVYRGARFETINVSADTADRDESARSALRRANAGALTNYRFAAEMSELVAALDPKWDGGLPFTLLVARDGKVLFQGQGTLETDRLRRTIEDWLAAH